MMRMLILTLGTTLLSAVVISNAYFKKQQFYPTVVYLLNSSRSLGVRSSLGLGLPPCRVHCLEERAWEEGIVRVELAVSFARFLELIWRFTTLYSTGALLAGLPPSVAGHQSSEKTLLWHSKSCRGRGMSPLPPVLTGVSRFHSALSESVLLHP